MEVKEELKKIVCDVLNDEVEIADNINLMYDLNMDSIQIVNVVAMLEERFDIEFELEDLNIDNLVSFSKLAETVERLIEE